MRISNSYKNFFRAAFFTGCFFIAACENSEKELKDLTSKRIGVEEAKGVTIDYNTAGKSKAKLIAPYMLRYQDTVPYIEFPKTVHADFFDDSAAVETRLDAHYGRYMETESKVFLRDSVRVFNRNGDTLYCKELYWDRSRKGSEFYTESRYV